MDQKEIEARDEKETGRVEAFSVPLALGMTIALVLFYALPLGANAR